MSPARKSSGRRRSSRGGTPGGRSGPPPTRLTPGGRRTRPLPSGRRGRARSSGRAGRAGTSGGRRPAGRESKRSVGGEQIEGRQAVRELLVAGNRKVNEIWIASDAERATILDDIRELAEGAGVPVRDVAKSRFASQARCEAPQGVLALAAPLPEHDLDDLLSDSRRARVGGDTRRQAAFLVALDGVTDPGNLGAVLRSAECAGATGVILPRHRAVNVTPAATKAAAGAVEYLPVAMVGGLPAALARLRDAGVLLVGLDTTAETTVYGLPSVDGPVCLVLGAEGRGLSRLVRRRCDVVATIPLRGRLASLNVSAAAALACFEIARSR